MRRTMSESEPRREAELDSDRCSVIALVSVLPHISRSEPLRRRAQTLKQWNTKHRTNKDRESDDLGIESEIRDSDSLFFLHGLYWLWRSVGSVGQQMRLTQTFQSCMHCEPTKGSNPTNQVLPIRRTHKEYSNGEPVFACLRLRVRHCGFCWALFNSTLRPTKHSNTICSFGYTRYTCPIASARSLRSLYRHI